MFSLTPRSHTCRREGKFLSACIRIWASCTDLGRSWLIDCCTAAVVQVCSPLARRAVHVLTQRRLQPAPWPGARARGPRRLSGGGLGSMASNAGERARPASLDSPRAFWTRGGDVTGARSLDRYRKLYLSASGAARSRCEILVELGRGRRRRTRSSTKRRRSARRSVIARCRCDSPSAS